MASFSTLPDELVVRITAFAAARSDLASLRLVNKRLSVVATEAYFESIALYPEWSNEQIYDYHPKPTDWPNKISYDVAFFRSILDSDSLKPLVKKVTVYTCNPDCDHHPQWAHHKFDGDMPSEKPSEDWNSCFERIPEFPSLRSLSLCFDRHGGGANDKCNIFQTYDTRLDELARFIKMFARCSDGIKELGIRHLGEAPGLTNFNKSKDEDNPQTNRERDTMLSQLVSLRMGIVHEQCAPEGGSSLKICEHNHTIWQQFPSRWLAPATNTLKHLTLYSDLPVGWFPKVDFRGIHFPHLDSLALGQFIFSHDWQFDWILTHSDTLKHIYLDHCSILFQIGHANGDWLDEYGFPVKGEHGWPNSLEPHSEHADPVGFRSYATRWHEVFDRFSTSLPHLSTFRFGRSSGWKFHTEHRDPYNPDIGFPIQPWEQETEIVNRVWDGMYLLYDDWTENEEYHVKWSDSEEIQEFEQSVRDQMEDPPNCFAEDEAALRTLSKKLGIPWATADPSDDE